MPRTFEGYVWQEADRFPDYGDTFVFSAYKPTDDNLSNPRCYESLRAVLYAEFGIVPTEEPVPEKVKKVKITITVED